MWPPPRTRIDPGILSSNNFDVIFKWSNSACLNGVCQDATLQCINTTAGEICCLTTQVIFFQTAGTFRGERATRQTKFCTSVIGWRLPSTRRCPLLAESTRQSLPSLEVVIYTSVAARDSKTKSISIGGACNQYQLPSVVAANMPEHSKIGTSRQYGLQRKGGNAPPNQSSCWPQQIDADLLGHSTRGPNCRLVP